jgi:hypothetical protein
VVNREAMREPMARAIWEAVHPARPWSSRTVSHLLWRTAERFLAILDTAHGDLELMSQQVLLDINVSNPLSSAARLVDSGIFDTVRGL